MHTSPPGQLVAIDAPMLVFQSFYGIPDTFHDVQGRAVNAVFGFTLRLLDLLEQVTQNEKVTSGAGAKTRIALCWDESLGSGFRHRLYAPYKANRPPADEAFIYQLQRCADVGDALGLVQFASEEFEADDLIASLVHWQHQAEGDAIIVSQDKDLAQAVGETDLWWAFPKQAPSDHAQMLAHWQMPLPRIADYLALCGDAVDNIPGVKGVGAVTARLLMQTYTSLENLFEQVDAIPSLPVRGAAALQKKLLAQRDDVFLFRELTLLRSDALTKKDWHDATTSASEYARFKQVMDACDLWRRVQRKAQTHFDNII